MTDSILISPDLFELKDGYAPKRKTTETVVTVRHMTQGEILLQHGRRISFIANDGTCRECLITSVKTWKTRPDVAIGVKYGLKEYANLDMTEALRRFVVIVGRETRPVIR